MTFTNAAHIFLSQRSLEWRWDFVGHHYKTKFLLQSSPLTGCDAGQKNSPSVPHAAPLSSSRKAWMAESHSIPLGESHLGLVQCLFWVNPEYHRWKQAEFLLRSPLCPSLTIFHVLLCFPVKTQGGTESAGPWLTVASAFLFIHNYGNLQDLLWVGCNLPVLPLSWGQCQWPSWLIYCGRYCIVPLYNVLTSFLGTVVPG